MYKITCCRFGKNSNYNCYNKGCFIKTFDSLSIFARWVCEVNKKNTNIFFPYLRKELTKKERIILSFKINSVLKG